MLLSASRPYPASRGTGHKKLENCSVLIEMLQRFTPVDRPRRDSVLSLQGQDKGPKELSWKVRG